MIPFSRSPFDVHGSSFGVKGSEVAETVKVVLAAAAAAVARAFWCHLSDFDRSSVGVSVFR